MENLPTCNTEFPLPQDELKIYDEDNYELLKQVFTDYIGADCWALTVNDEIIFNSYDLAKPLREQLIESGIRSMLYMNPHSNLLSTINRKGQVAVIEIYMFESAPFKLVFNYDPTNQTYSAKKFVSEAYAARAAAANN